MATHRRQTQSPRKIPAGSPQNSVDGFIASPRAKRRNPSPFQEQEQEEDEEGYAGPTLPEPIWCHIHSLLSLRDAARAACVSHAFRWSWRHLPNLTFSEDSLGLRLNTKTRPKKGISRDFTRKVDHILKNHSGRGVKTLEFLMSPHYKARDHQRIDTWLQMADTPGIEKVTLYLSSRDDTYKFPCSLLSDRNGGSIRHLELANCSFCPMARSWCLRPNLAILDLSCVHVTGDGLWCFLSSSSALERLSLKYCSGIICLKIPGSLQRLGYLTVAGCYDLQSVEIKAPNLSTFNFGSSHHRTHISLGEALRVKELHMDSSSYYYCTRAELASSITPNSETADVYPSMEGIDAPVGVSSKSVLLKRLYIAGIGSTPFYLCTKYSTLFGTSHSVEEIISYVSSQLADHVSFYSLFQGRKTIGLTKKEVRLVEGACHMLKAWLS